MSSSSLLGLLGLLGPRQPARRRSRPAPDEERRILALLAAAGPTGLSRALLAAAAESPEILDRLAARGLVEEDDDNGVPLVRVPALVAATAEDGPAEVDGVRQLLLAVASPPSGTPEGWRPDDDLAGSRAVLAGAQHGLWAEVAAAGPVLETRLMTSGRWGQWSKVLDATLRAAREREDRGLEGHALHQLGTLAFCLGDRAQARSLLEQAYEIRRSLGDTEGAETTAANLRWAEGMQPPGGVRDNGQPPTGPGLFASHTVLWSLLVLAVLGVTTGVGLALRPTSGPSLESSTTTLDLGRVVLGTEARTSFSVTSTGGASGSAVSVESQPAAFTASTRCPDLDRGSTCDITVRFRPTVAGAQSGRVSVLLDGSEAVDVQVRGVGVEPPAPAGVTVRPDAVDFGRQDVGSASEPERVEIVTEPGVRLREPTISGARPDDFAVVRETCGPRQDGRTCAVLVVYAPKAGGRSVARLSLPVEGRRPVQVLLTGVAVTSKAAVQLEPPTVQLGQVALGTSKEATLALRNSGTSDVQVTQPLLGGPAAGDFQVDGCAEPVPAGASCTLSVTFGPREVGQRVAVLTIDLATGEDPTATLVGEGTAAADETPPQLSLKSLTAEAESAKGAVVTYQVSAVDDVDGTVQPDCDRAAGDTFPIGETTVTCTATDAAGNVGRASAVIRVLDTTGPTLEVPADITREVKYDIDKVTVTWKAVAADLVDGDVPVTCTPRSGSTFRTTGSVDPLPSSTEKPHVITCTAEDASGNLTERTFLIHVLYESTAVE